MPTLPSYGPRRVLPEGGAIPPGPIEAHGGGQDAVFPFAASAGLMREAARIQEDAELRADQVGAAEDDAALSELETRLLHAPQTGALNIQGKAAMGAMESVRKEWESGVASIGKGAITPRRKMALERASAQRYAHISRALNQHSAREIERYEDQTTEALVKNEQAAAIANWGDPLRVALSLDRQMAALQDMANRKGFDPEAFSQIASQEESRTNMGVLSQMLNAGQDMEAKKYVQENKDGFWGEDRIRAGRLVEEGSYRGEAQRRADGILSSTKGRAEAREEARKIEDEKLRGLVEDKIVREWALRDQETERAKDVRYAGALNDAIEAVENGNDPYQVITGEVWDALDPGEKMKVRGLISDITKKGDVETDERVSASYYSMTDEERGKLTPEKLLALRPGLSKADYKKIESDWGRVRASGPASYKGLFSDDEAIARAMQQSRVSGVNVGASPSDVIKGSPEAFYRIKGLFDMRLEADPEKKADAKGKRQILDSIMIEDFEQTHRGPFVTWAGPLGGWENTVKKKAYEIGPGDFIDVPPDAMPRIKRELEAKEAATGKKFTEARAKRLYAAIVSGNRVEAARILSGGD